MALNLCLQLEVLNAIANRIRRRALRNERYLNRSNSIVLQLDDIEFKKTFRVSRALFSLIAKELCPHLRTGTTRRAISPQMKILVTLRFLAQGNYQSRVGSDRLLAVAQPTVSIILKEVVDAINQILCPKYIQFPSENEMQDIASHFENKYRMPGIIGVVDCTHVRITTPFKNEFLYVNGKHFHSLNVQLICDHKMMIRSVNAKFPGSNHDSFIWQQSKICQFVSQNLVGKQFWLLADSGYPLEPWLIVPFEDPTSEAQTLFNEYHSSCHSIIERCTGTLKERWRCLRDIHGLYYSPDVAGKIINASIALHNLCLMHMNDYTDIDPPLDIVDVGPCPDDQQNDFYERGAENRDLLIGYILHKN